MRENLKDRVPIPTGRRRRSPGLCLSAVVACRRTLWCPRTATRLVDEALGVWARPGFDRFMCLPRLRFDPFDYQLDAASRVLRHMQGRAILADEVGLGKTIEAGLVLSELRLRGLADRALVIVPAGLVEQWREELDRKFALPTVVPRAGDWTAEDLPGPQPIVVGVAADGAAPAPGVAHRRCRLGSRGRRRGAPPEEPAQRVGPSGSRPPHALPALAHGHAGGEPAVRPVRARQPRAARRARQSGRVPIAPRQHGRRRRLAGSQRRHAAPGAARRDGASPAQRGEADAPAPPRRDRMRGACARRSDALP